MGVVQSIDRNRMVVLGASTEVLSRGIGKLGPLAQPAVWVLDAAVNDTSPDAADIGLYGLGLFGGPAGWAAAAVGMLKGFVDDDSRAKLQAAQASEPEEFRAFIRSCTSYSISAPALIVAQEIASRGGTAWQHSNGLWVYITDARDRMVANYQPKVARVVYQPVDPPTPAGAGKYRWHMVPR